MSTIPKAPSGLTAKFSEEQNCWTAYDPAARVTLVYDENQKGWFPMWDEELIQQQQSIYVPSSSGNGRPTQNSLSTQGSSSSGNRKRSRNQNPEDKAPPPPRPTSSIYVTGLPKDVSMEEVSSYFSKGGIIMEDLAYGGKKIKLYTHPDGTLKGDALITYLKPESVDLAISLLDESSMRPGDDVGLASFSKSNEEENGDASTSSSTMTEKNGKRKGPADPRAQVDISVLKKRRAALERKLDWQGDDEEDEMQVASKKAKRYAKIVVLVHMFTLKELDEEPELLFDLKEDIQAECEKLGEVTGVTVYDQMEDGVCSVRFKTPEAALACVKLMNGRYFAGRKIEASIYDGSRKLHKVKERDAGDESRRLDAFSEWIEGFDSDDEEDE
ncbi:MAG: hypothetical protein DHS80DRAFT_30834 [Piptocephalis tieghemiana]|nr:MAG: hypothetical protein DHS80DRAFT_30834 [Piptocephalis tieghemiana]